MRHAPAGGRRVLLRPKETYVEVGKFALDKLLNMETYLPRRKHQNFYAGT